MLVALCVTGSLCHPGQGFGTAQAAGEMLGWAGSCAGRAGLSQGCGDHCLSRAMGAAPGPQQRLRARVVSGRPPGTARPVQPTG